MTISKSMNLSNNSWSWISIWNNWWLICKFIDWYLPFCKFRDQLVQFRIDRSKWCYSNFKLGDHLLNMNTILQKKKNTKIFVNILFIGGEYYFLQSMFYNFLSVQSSQLAPQTLIHRMHNPNLQQVWIII